MNHLQQYAADHRYLLEQVATQTGLHDLVAIDLDQFYEGVMRSAHKGPLLPIEGVLVRDWAPDNRKLYPGIQLGARVYHIDDLKFVRVRFGHDNYRNTWGFDFVAVERKNYRRFYRLALKARKNNQPPCQPPVLTPQQSDLLWQNTIGYLERSNLRRIKEYGGRAKRGVLLMGPPGNGKTSACRWIWHECLRRRWEWRLVTPDAYRQARASDSIEELFSVDRRGIVFFDDMDIALRDRETVAETEDQSVFLSALDGITVNEGVVFLFTTNCSLDLIDRAFKRPGRIDLVLHFDPPSAELRRELIQRWHPDVRSMLDISKCVHQTDGMSFAEVEEIKNLLILHFMEQQHWDWDQALRQWEINRHDLTPQRKRRSVGFGRAEDSSL